MTGESQARLTTIWKEQDMSTMTITTRDLEARERKLKRQIRKRNLFEYLAGAAAGAVLLTFGVSSVAAAAELPELMMGVGKLLLAAAIAFICLQLHRRSTRRVASDPTGDALAYHLTRLARERDLLRSVWLWYVAPTLPGFVLIYGSMFFMSRQPLVFAVIASLLTLAFLVGVVLFNRRAAARLDREIDNLRTINAGNR